jgi:hypothetical protein
MTDTRRLVDLAPLRHGVGALLLWLLVSIDLVLIALHLVRLVSGTEEGMAADLGADRSYGELLIYIKLAWIAALAVLVARRRGSRLFVALALISMIVLFEDALSLHERVGVLLAGTVRSIAPGFAGQGILALQIGELVWLGAVALVIGVVFIVAYRRADHPDRTDARTIAAFFLVVAVLAVGVDTVHSVFELGSTGDIVFTVIEEGGELVAFSPPVAFAFALASRETGPRRITPTPDAANG